MVRSVIKVTLTLLWMFFVTKTGAQNGYIISGKISADTTGRPMQNVTLHLKGSKYSALSKADGSFRLHTSEWFDSLQISSVGFAGVTIALKKGYLADLNISMKSKSANLQEVMVVVAKKQGRSFMERVIAYKANNNPLRFHGFSYQRYTRSELDVDNIDYQKIKGNGVKSLMLKTYAGLDSNAKNDKELPIYFAETLVNSYHAVSPAIDKENLIAKKSLGLKTDELIGKLDKFYFNFNVYDDWILIFNQTYTSPLNSNAFSYYRYFTGDTMVENNDTILQVRFMPIRSYEKAFVGTMWINTNNLAVENIDMHLTKTVNLNFISDIIYREEYQKIYDSSEKKIYMPFKFSSEVKFEGGLELLGLPVPEKKSSLKLLVKNTTVTDRIKLNVNESSKSVDELVKIEQANGWDKSALFWSQNRPDSLSPHEKNIYWMVDSLKKNKRFQQSTKLIALTGTGYWDFANEIRAGAYTSFISKDPIEGWRLRLGFLTMPRISKRLNVFGYGAYGMKDRKVKGSLGVKYLWNEVKWTKTTLNYGADYDYYISDESDELDRDNLIHSLFRKNIPFTKTFIKYATLKHEQYLSADFAAKASLGYREISPVFNFKYRLINPIIDKPFDSIYGKKLPVAEASFGVRYAHSEKTTILNYDNIKLGTFSPVFSANYTYGFEQGKAMFSYHKVNIGIEQRLHLPPKTMLFYKLEAGQVFGTVPYLLLNIPAGNEYYVASKYQFNTMAPYEFAADRYVSLHTRFYLGGALFDKFPLLQKLGWRERFSFNAYCGNMNKANIDYNKGSNFNLLDRKPFMEASAGIENIFHLISIEYYRRLSYLDHPFAKRDGFYLGFGVTF
ncbi:MAG: hypothetical protein JWQ09_2050 [Segetibacter sp.]|nr:hypothetical protein [Segetibacter sp.]